MRHEAWLIVCDVGPAVRIDQASAAQYAADHHGLLLRLVPAEDAQDAARIDWLAAGGLTKLMNAMVGDWDSDVLAFGCATAKPAPLDIRAEIDRLRTS